MRGVVLLVLGLGAASAAGWWAWHEHRARPLVVPASSDFAYVPDSIQNTVASSMPSPPTSGVMDELPRGSGRTQGTRRRARSGTGLASGLSAEGSMRWMRGARSIPFDVDAALMVTVTASVEQGRFRVYLGEGERYRWAEATAEQPLEISGRLLTGTSVYFFFAEAIGGRAEGIQWTVDGTR